MMKLVCASAVVASVSGVASAQVFFDRGDWVAAAGGGVVSPDFSAFAPTEFAPGVSTDLGGFFSVTANGGALGDAELNTVPNFVFDFAPGGLASVEFNFDTPITAFAAVWSNTFVQDGFTVSSGSTLYDLNVLSDPLGSQFIGFVEADGFSTVRFTTTVNPGNGDDLVFFNTFEYVPVPAPASAFVLGGAAIASRRRR